jgi:hypothetical protein
LTKLLQQIERHCPCGARPEASDFPHSIGCPVAKALDLLAASSVATGSWQPHYSGKASVKFWDAVRGIDDDRLYVNGCRLQDLEQRILDQLNRFAPPADAPQEHKEK